MVKRFKPDIVVNATGSVPLVPPIPGLKENIAEGNVATIFDMINNLNAGKYPDDFCKGKEVVVVGGGSVGLDVIEYFAPRGAKCTIIDMLPQIGMLADPITKCSMRETHDKYDVKEYVNTALQEVKEDAFTVQLPDGIPGYGYVCIPDRIFRACPSYHGGNDGWPCDIECTRCAGISGSGAAGIMNKSCFIMQA